MSLFQAMVKPSSHVLTPPRQAMEAGIELYNSPGCFHVRGPDIVNYGFRSGWHVPWQLGLCRGGAQQRTVSFSAQASVHGMAAFSGPFIRVPLNANIREDGFRNGKNLPSDRGTLVSKQEGRTPSVCQERSVILALLCGMPEPFFPALQPGIPPCLGVIDDPIHISEFFSYIVFGFYGFKIFMLIHFLLLFKRTFQYFFVCQRYHFSFPCIKRIN